MFVIYGEIMFGIDVYTMQTLAPSVAMIAVIFGAMVFGAIKMIKLTKSSKPQ